jgi:hypothetical protein
MAYLTYDEGEQSTVEGLTILPIPYIGEFSVVIFLFALSLIRATLIYRSAIMLFELACDRLIVPLN